MFAIQGSKPVLTQPIDFEDLPQGFVDTDTADGIATVGLGLQVTDQGGLTYSKTVNLTVHGIDDSVAPPISFEVDALVNQTVPNPTSLQFGPDGRLYVSDLKGAIHVFNVSKTAGGYAVAGSEIITLAQTDPEPRRRQRATQSQRHATSGHRPRRHRDGCQSRLYMSAQVILVGVAAHRKAT